MILIRVRGRFEQPDEGTSTPISSPNCRIEPSEPIFDLVSENCRYDRVSSAVYGIVGDLLTTRT